MPALKGYRTYIALGAIVLVNVLEVSGIMPPEVADNLKQWLYPISIGYLRASNPA